MSIDLVTPALRGPESLLALDAAGWDLLIRQARRANLLARLAWDLRAAGKLERVPTAPRQHLEAMLVVAARQRIEVHAEVWRLCLALGELKAPIVLLKGAAYAVADLPCSHGRLFGDIDILLPRQRLADAESLLMRDGWVSHTSSAYDQMYYRRWMHELPPLQHLQRGTELDVHHNILPATARRVPDASLLLADSLPISLPAGFTHSADLRVLSPIDRLLHSACHLFHESEMPNGLRDLADLDALLRQGAQGADFWQALCLRANHLQLARPLYYALHLCQLLLATPVSAAAFSDLAKAAPPRWRRALMDALYRQGLRPHHHQADEAWSALARSLLYLRGHWLRMPPHLLARHLSRKAWHSLYPQQEPSGN